MGPRCCAVASILVATACVVMASGEARAAGERALVFHFTPTERAQIAIWIEKPDGTFLATVGLTQAVSVRGIGNRPGATQMNSGYHWPYGRREGVLPIWAHRRARRAGRRAVPAHHLPEPARRIRVANVRGLDARRIFLPGVQAATRAETASTR